MTARWLRAVGVTAALSCSPQPQAAPPPHTPSPPEAAAPVEAMPTPARDVPVAPDVAATTHVAIVERETLAALERSGFGAGPLTVGQPAATLRELAALPAWRKIFDALRADIADTKRRFPLAKPTSMLGFRQFDASWLASSEMRFELVGVFNRLDRRTFHERGCGEVRFVYRLRYATTQGGEPMTGRLPLTLNVVFFPSAEGDATAPCRDVATSWQRPDDDAGDLATWLVERGALSEPMRRRWTLASVETNLQTIRLQSTVHTSLAGHIEYSLRVFRPRDGSTTDFFEAPLENTPDVARLKTDAAARRELLTLLKTPESLARLDQGTLVLPSRFLARHATSVSPRGLTRRGNRPFRQLFSPEDFADVDLSATRTLRSPTALLRRLDGASCTGCHQSGTIAGFHHVGEEPVAEPVAPALLFGSSLHLRADLERRRAYVDAIASGREPQEFRPLPEAQGTGRGFAAPCGLGDPGFAEWSCDEGLSCQRLEDDEVGTCLPASGLGAPCEYGVMKPGAIPQRDQVHSMSRRSCGQRLSCDRNIQGFPLGSCAGACNAAGPEDTCGPFLDIDGYQNCLRARTPATDCASEFVFDTGLRQCDASHHCRHDYVCARTSAGGAGACVPPYFVFGLRSDGYPLPG